MLDFVIKKCSAGNGITSNYEKNVVFNTSFVVIIRKLCSFVVIIRKYVVIITLVTCDTKAVSLVEQEVSCI